MSLRRLWVLASNLPESSPLRRKIVGPEDYQWTGEMRMLAAIHEQLQYNTWVIGLFNAHKTKGKKNIVPQPTMIPRPGVKADEKTRRRAKPGGLVFGARGKTQAETVENQEALRRYFGADGKRKVGR